MAEVEPPSPGRAPGATQSDLARSMGVEQPTVATMLRRLDGSGLVERRGDPADRGLVRVWPAARVRAVHAEVLRRWAAVAERMLAGLPPAAVEALRELVSTTTANLSAVEARPAPG